MQHALDVNYNILHENNLQLLNNQLTYVLLTKTINKKREREGAGTLLYSMQMYLQMIVTINNTTTYNELINRQTLPADVIEFIDLCEQGILYDDLMRRLGIPAQRRKGFKRLFFSQVFFGKIKTTGRVRELFARDFPTVYKAINDLKRKDHRQLAYSASSSRVQDHDRHHLPPYPG